MEQNKQIVREILNRFEASEAAWPIELKVRVERGAQALARGFQKPFSGVGQTAQKPQALKEEGGSQPVEGLMVDDTLFCSITSPRDGWLHLFNLGSGGEVQHLVPANPQDPGLYLRAEQPASINSKPWKEEGPRTAENGLPETFLAVVTQNKTSMKLSDLHLLLAGEEKHIGMRGGIGGVEDVASVPFGLPVDSWGFAILKMNVS